MLKKLYFFFYILFLCISCTTTQRLLFNGSGAGEVRKDIGRIEGAEQTINEATIKIERYSEDIDRLVENEGGLIEELTNLLRRIRGRGDASSKGANE